MQSSSLNLQPSLSTVKKRNPQAWYRPIFSPEHGVYVVLLVAFSTGAAAAQAWTWTTTLALLGAFAGFQAEHPWMLQIKQRSSIKPRFWVWGGLYSLVAGGIALYLLWHQGWWLSPLWIIYVGAFAAFCVDGMAVFRRGQKSVANELITFAAVCLSAPFAYIVTTGTLVPELWGLWALNTLFFSSAIFTVKFRKSKTHSAVPGEVFHAIATLLILTLACFGLLTPLTASAFSVALLKFGIILWQRDWYCTTKIQRVALLETSMALLFLVVTALSLLPARWPA
ncbi:YwiC-like family protein [Nodosilinea sp. LEGE 07298]|uniref:YwiC-like family protein n=1 Tax=Nodosilinea sp. LEGE 07298 TaxID=2777970 RepID=UPI00188058B5|nr:YwiC-like family protein [Nodosilinea sp. LEGE 07298]MBE9109236.1 YwiC-like family protein [Nodosilinea sp. LEGE 07298]